MKSNNPDTAPDHNDTEDAFSWTAGIRSHARASALGRDEIERIVKYLVEPTRAGIWSFSGIWEPNSQISKSIWNEIEPLFAPSENEDAPPNRRHPGISFSPDQERPFRDRIFNKMTFILYLFTRLSADKHANSHLLMSDTSSIDQAVTNLINLDKIRSEHSEALDYFKNEIYFDGFLPSFRIARPHRFKNGIAFLIKNVHSDDGFEIFSTERSALQPLFEFMKMLGKTSDGHVMPVFSPEERVFSPYFALLEAAFPYCVQDESVRPAFVRAFSDYRAENFAGCVRNLGVIGEDYLVQIYETYFREPCPKGLTLGQVFDLINRRVSDKFKKPPKPTPDVNPIFERIRELLSNAPTTPSTKDHENILKVLRDMMNLIKDERARMFELISDISKEPINASLLPKSLRENMIDLIRYRNAVSHRSRVVIGSYEALRSVYICVTLMLWWSAEKRITNWSATQEEIVMKAAARHSSGLSSAGRKNSSG